MGSTSFGKLRPQTSEIAMLVLAGRRIFLFLGVEMVAEITSYENSYDGETPGIVRVVDHTDSTGVGSSMNSKSVG